jgi:hypothetical protein
MLLVISGIFVKWVVDDFRRSRVSAVTWFLAALSLLGPLWAAMYVISPAAQASLDQLRHHRVNILITATNEFCRVPKIPALYEASTANTIVDGLLSRDFRRLRRESGFQEGIHDD